MTFKNVYAGRRVLVTGHTGFKGSWLVLWLQSLGAEVSAVALPPETSPAHWNLLGLDVASSHVDIRDAQAIRQTVAQARPEIVFHLAAQPLVRRSYRNPLDTWATNVMGTAHLLDACREVEGLAAIVVVTTDKCYDNKEWVWGYREIDPLGGHDPYSASKAGSELVTASYRASFFDTPSSPLVASARAGNVIGGGDWSEDRLIPDLVRSVEASAPLQIRSPRATRPWQHVLECLSGYLTLGQHLLDGHRACAEAWNFGPDRDGNREVEQVLEAMKATWPAVRWTSSDQPHPHEARLLHLDSGKARESLDWRPVWTFEEGVEATAAWYRAFLERGEVLSTAQLGDYVRAAEQRGLRWAVDAS